MVNKRRNEQFFRVFLWIGVFILVITLVVFSVLRTREVITSIHTQTEPPVGSIDLGYVRQPVLTFLHIFPGLLFIFLGVFQFMKPLRNKFINVHRIVGRLYILLGLLVGITAIIMGLVIRFGGYAETTAVTIFGLLFIYCLVKAYRHIRRKEFLQHREWMIRAFSIGIAVGTMRPVIGMLSAFTDIRFADFFGYTFWFAFIMNLTVAELWIRFTRKPLGTQVI